MKYPFVALAVTFALGVLVTLDAYDRHPVACKPDPVPAARPVREAFALTHPLSCERGFVLNCPDFKPCKGNCL